MDNQTIRDNLFHNQDLKYQAFHSGLCPGVNKIIGVRIPILRKLAKQLAKDHPENYLDNAWNDYYEEIMLQGLVIGYMKADFSSRLPYLTAFIPKIDNWAVCDSCCSSMKFIKGNEEAMLTYLTPYLSSKAEFQKRFALIILLDYYINETYLDFVLDTLNQSSCEDYYINMAVAWALAECYIKFPKQTLPYIKSNALNQFTHNKSIQKICESYRVSKEDKAFLRTLKRKS